ncbi:MAG: HAMP domain-containing sensor histidine kinase [Bacillota bacterium]|nr:HAMP domain-containing sensor histidine kinase [Bacillota bacterium]
MKTRLDTIRIKLILAYLLSAVLAGFCIFLVFIAVSVSFYSNFEMFSNWFDKHIIVLFLITMAVFIVLMSAFFVLLTQKGIKYLEKITQIVEKISKGNLGIQISDERTDELGNLSKTINQMSSELKRLIEKERKWEKEKDDMISNISHDLRTPLTSIIGYLQLIINYEKNGNEVYMAQYANIAYSKSLELKVLIDQLFEYTSISNKEFKLNIIKIDAAELINQVVLGQMPVLQEKSLQCRMHYPDEKVYIYADAVLIARVFDNLITNAVKYGSNSENIDVELSKESNDAVIRITNYGVEIPQSDLPYIFDRFYCVDKSRSSNRAGTGLGLAIVKSIVEKLNGKIYAYSNDNKTVFEVRLNSNL